MIEHGYPPHLTPEPWGPLKVWGRIRRAFAEWRAGFFETTESERTMKIHRWSARQRPTACHPTAV